MAADHFRAPCRPVPGGCRKCGEPPTGRFKFYCSKEHQLQFDADH